MSVIADLANVVGKVSPIVATALGSPIAGIVLSLIGQKFGVKTDNIQNVIDKINTDPNAAIKLKELELEHESDLKKIALSSYQSHLADIEDARKTNAEQDKLYGKRDWLIPFLVVASVLIFGGCLVASFFSENNSHIYLFLIGQMAGTYLSVYGYYFGGMPDMSPRTNTPNPKLFPKED